MTADMAEINDRNTKKNSWKIDKEWKNIYENADESNMRFIGYNSWCGLHTRIRLRETLKGGKNIIYSLYKHRLTFDILAKTKKAFLNNWASLCDGSSSTFWPTPACHLASDLIHSIFQSRQHRSKKSTNIRLLTNSYLHSFSSRFPYIGF